MVLCQVRDVYTCGGAPRLPLGPGLEEVKSVRLAWRLKYTVGRTASHFAPATWYAGLVCASMLRAGESTRARGALGVRAHVNNGRYRLAAG